MPQVPGMHVPEQIYVVLQVPAMLGGMEMPRASTPWDLLAKLGFRHVVRLAKVTPCFDPDPLQVLRAVDLDDLADGGLPENPETERALIEEIAQQIANCLRAGEGVLVHCVGGRGRTGTVIGRVLRLLGYPAAEVVGFLNRIHQLRGKPGWPESSWQQELIEGDAGKMPRRRPPAVRSDAASAKVGLFWVLKGKLLASAVPLAQGVEYGDAVHGQDDHVHYWSQLQRLHPELRQLDYEEVPRGRVLFIKTTKKFCVYMDKVLHKSTIKAALIKEYSLPKNRTEFMTDPHYTTDPDELKQMFGAP